jgi:golgi phosphoprotein 3
LLLRQTTGAPRMTTNDLTIPESILLLALADQTGEIKGEYLNYALAGAALTELVLQGRLAELGDPPKKLSIVDAKPTGDPYVDACLEAVIAKGTGKDARVYIETIGAKGSLTHPLYDRLTERGIVSEEKSKVLLFFTRTTYPEANPAPESALEKRLLGVITGSGPVDVRDGAIISLAHHVDILKYDFDRDVLKARKDRIKAIAEGGMLPPDATRAAIENMKAAVMIAVIVPAIVAATG